MHCWPGRPTPGAWLIVAASAVFTGVNIVVVRRQSASHTLLLLVSALAWLIGNLLFAAGQGADATLPWWFSFLVMTIAAERLEMTRLMRRRPAAPALLVAVLAAMLLGAAASFLSRADRRRAVRRFAGRCWRSGWSRSTSRAAPCSRRGSAATWRCAC